MLGKLIKYDLKSVSRLLIPLHLILIVVSFLGRFIMITKAYKTLPVVMVGFLISGYIIFLVVIAYTTTFLILHRFYKNLFSDEGYLTWTLPVTPGQHLFTKLISGSIWMIFDYTIMFLSLGIVFLVPDVLKHSGNIIQEMDQALKMSTATFFISTFIVGLVAIPTGIAFYYFCITLGQLFSKHRVIASIIMYFAISTLVGIIMLTIMIAVGLLPLITGANLTNPTFAAPTPSDYMIRSYYLSGVGSIIQGILSYIGALYIMKKRINLE